MLFWLDRKLLLAPAGFSDATFHWLSGRFYWFEHGFSAQLFSIEWRKPKPGTIRRLFGRDFILHQADRYYFLRTVVQWRVVDEIQAAKDLLALEAELRANMRPLILHDNWPQLPLAR